MSNEYNHENMDNQQTETTATLTNEESKNPTISTERVCETNSNIKVIQSQSNPSESNTGVVIKNTESQSLNSLLLAYDSGSDSESSSSEMKKIHQNWQAKDDSEDSSSSSSASTCSSMDNDDDNVTDSSSEDEEKTSFPASAPSQNRGAIKKKHAVPKSDVEWARENLPPLPDLSKLNISVEDESCIHMGDVLAIVDEQVTVGALPNTPAYDLDTLLFLDNGKRPMGFVFDVLGPVTAPIYAIRFNSVEDIENLGIKVNTKVYSAPTSKHTQYVFLQQLLKMKGSDASWLDDAEVPQEFADYSDDESECYHRHGNKKSAPHLKRPHSSKNYQNHERMVNRKNALNTQLNTFMDSGKQNRRNKATPRQSQAPQMNSLMPMFDPSVPPPNYGHHTSFYQQTGPRVQVIPNYPVAPGTVAANYSSGGSQFTQSSFMSNFVPNFSQANQTGPAVPVMPNYPAAPGTEAANCSSGESQFTQSSSMNSFVTNLGQGNFANYFRNHADSNHRGPSQN